LIVPSAIVCPFLKKGVFAALPDTTGSGYSTAGIESNRKREQNKRNSEESGHHNRELIAVDQTNPVFQTFARQNLDHISGGFGCEDGVGWLGASLRYDPSHPAALSTSR
jgi:hypothetical protein